MQMTFKTAQKIYELCNNLENKVLPFRISYKIAKLKELLDEEIPKFTKQIQEIIARHADTDETGQCCKKDGDELFINIKEGEVEQCMNEIEEIQKANLIIQDIEFSLEELEDCELTIKEIQILLPLIKAE